ncbi:MAG: hypothetical protein Q9198_006032 [Flavoplaca austrocitrina]
MAVLGAIVAHQRSPNAHSAQTESFGFRALKPAIAIYPQFLEKLVGSLSAADHALCANALHLINALMRDAITNDGEAEWPRFIKRLQDLGVIKAVYGLMQSNALQDLAHPLLEFQALMKVLLRKWRDVPVDLHKPEHRRALKAIHLASNPEKIAETVEDLEDGRDGKNDKDCKDKKHNPEKWRRLGFETENPGLEFEDTGYLGMMDLADYVRKHANIFQRLLLEQSTLSPRTRCPIARASLAVTAILYDCFEVDGSDLDDTKAYLALETRSTYDKIFKPLILQWSRLHFAGLQAFSRLWKATGAEREDFLKLVDLVRVLLDAVVNEVKRDTSIQEVEGMIQDYDCERLRKIQMENLQLMYEDTWAHHLRQVRDELNHEALQFMKEQRIRCLLQGAWFPNGQGLEHDSSRMAQSDVKPIQTLRYVKLSYNRRYLHYGDFDEKEDLNPDLDTLQEKLDLSLVSSVASNISATTPDSNRSSTSTLKNIPKSSTTIITIHGYLPSSSRGGSSHHRTNHKRYPSKSTSANSHANKEEIPLLILYPSTHSVASEWLDGLLMLLGQQPITSGTKKLTNLVAEYGLKIRLLNVRLDEPGPEAGEGIQVPSRDGLDENYFYDIGGI